MPIHRTRLKPKRVSFIDFSSMFGVFSEGKKLDDKSK